MTSDDHHYYTACDDRPNCTIPQHHAVEDMPAAAFHRDGEINAGYTADDLAAQEDDRECTCAMSESSMTSCAVHGYGAPEL